MAPKSHAGFTKVFVTLLTNYGHCVGPRKSGACLWCGYHTVLFYTLLCPLLLSRLSGRGACCPLEAASTFQPPPGTYYYIIHTQSDIPITSGEKTHILWKLGTCDFYLLCICSKGRQTSYLHKSSDILRYLQTS